MYHIINIANKTSGILHSVVTEAQKTQMEVMLYPECGKSSEEINAFVKALQYDKVGKAIITDSLYLIREIYLSKVVVIWRNWTNNEAFVESKGTEPEGGIHQLNRELEQAERYINQEISEEILPPTSRGHELAQEVSLEEYKEGIVRYVEEKIMPGGFLQAVLANDLYSAFGRADSSGLKHIHALSKYVFTHIPSPICGSLENIRNHIRSDKKYRVEP